MRVTLRAFLSLLEEEAADLRRRETGDLTALVDEIDGITARLAKQPRQHDPQRLARRLLDIADALLGELDDTRAALTSADRIGRREAQQARADALRDAAELVRGGRGAEELDRLAADAEPNPPTPLDDLAAELGIELHPADAPEETE